MPAKIANHAVPGRVSFWLLVLLLVVTSPALLATPVLELDQDSGKTPLVGQMEMLDVSGNGMSLAEVQAGLHSWSLVNDRRISMGLGHFDLWFRFRAHNASGESLRQLLEIAYATIDYADIYVLDIEGNLIRSHSMGDRLPFRERPIEHHYFITPLEWPAGATRDIYIHARTTGAMELPLMLWSENAFIRHDQNRQMLAGLYFGAMLMILIYNVVMFFGVRERSFLYYVGLVLCLPLFVASLEGYAFQYFWPEATAWNQRSIGVFLTLTITFGLLFSYDFLRLGTANIGNLVRTGTRLAGGLPIIMAATVLFADYLTMLTTVIVGAVIACSIPLLLSIYGLRTLGAAFRYYLMAWAALLMGGIAFAGNRSALLPQNIITENAVQLGSTLLVIMLSIAMAARLNQQRRSMYEAQLAALEHEREARQARDDALQIELKAKQELEAKVDERTRELKEANTALQELSSRDALTGLHNRRHFDEQLVREYVRGYRHQQSVALIFADIDRFKEFNDEHGHLVGDDCLRAVADLMSECITRGGDLLARYGGEEFCILLPGTDLEGARAVAERVRERIADTDYMVAGTPVPLTISLGVTAMVPATSEDAQNLVKQADQALYEAKRQGRNRVITFEQPAET